MLSTQSTSAIARRRQAHRRQQSLENPIIPNPLPANTRKAPVNGAMGMAGHRRGRSLDQSSTTVVPGFRPLRPQDLATMSSPSLRIPINTNQGQQLELQHLKQDTQLHIPSQPGFPGQDFQTTMQQQLGVNFIPGLAAPPPPPHNAHQQQALQDLQQHLNWYKQVYGISPSSQASSSPVYDQSGMGMNDMSNASMASGFPLAMPINGMVTPVSQYHSQTVPNTPQGYAPSWPSPPATNRKSARSQSFQMDVTPMTNGSNGLPTPAHTSYKQQTNPEAIQVGRPMNPNHMPTLFEESTGLNESTLLLQATAGAIQDFNDPDFDFGDADASSSEDRGLLNHLAPDMPASIVETGIPSHEIQQYIGDFDASDRKYACLFPGCDKRFGRKENVRAHVQTHLGDRQFRCDVCEKTFVRQHDLKRHIAIHSDERPHACVCGQSFARHDALTRHRQRGMCAGALPGFEKDPDDMPKRGRPRKVRPSTDDRADKSARQRKLNQLKKREVQPKADNRGANTAAAYASSNYSASERNFPVTPPDTSDAFDADDFLNMASVDAQFQQTMNSWKDTPPTSPATSSPTKRLSKAFAEKANVQSRTIDEEPSISPAMLSNHSSPSDHDDRDGSPSPYQPGSSPPSMHDNLFDQIDSPMHGAGGGLGSFDGGSSPADMDLFSDALDDDVVRAQPDALRDMFSPPGESITNSSVYNYSDNDALVFDQELAKAQTAMTTRSQVFDHLPTRENGLHDEDDWSPADNSTMADVLNGWLSAQ